MRSPILPKCLRVALSLLSGSVLAWGLAACATSRPRPVATSAAVVQFQADSNVRNPAANDAFPGVRRIVVRAIDGRVRPDAMLQVTDRVALRPGERTVLFAAESAAGRLTLSELTWEARPGEDYVVWPWLAESGAVLAEVKRGPYGEIVGRTTPWVPDREERGAP